MSDWLNAFKQKFTASFITDDRWKQLLNGLGVTLEITLFAVLIGIVIGVVVSVIRSTYDNTIETMRPGFSRSLLKLLNKICKIYLTGSAARGRSYSFHRLLFIFASSRTAFWSPSSPSASNSGAYVAEIFRSGIMSIDKGQMEAGRSSAQLCQRCGLLSFPRPFKNVLPALLNEVIRQPRRRPSPATWPWGSGQKGLYHRRRTFIR